MNEISLATKIKEIKVLIKVAPYYTGDRRKYPVKELKFPSMLLMRLPLNLSFDNLYNADDMINGLIMKNLEYISGRVMEEADAQLIRRPNGVDYTLLSIMSEKDESHKGIAEWTPIL